VNRPLTGHNSALRTPRWPQSSAAHRTRSGATPTTRPSATWRRYEAACSAIFIAAARGEGNSQRLACSYARVAAGGQEVLPVVFAAPNTIKRERPASLGGAAAGGLKSGSSGQIPSLSASGGGGGGSHAYVPPRTSAAPPPAGGTNPDGSKKMWGYGNPNFKERTSPLGVHRRSGDVAQRLTPKRPFARRRFRCPAATPSLLDRVKDAVVDVLTQPQSSQYGPTMYTSSGSVYQPPTAYEAARHSRPTLSSSGTFRQTTRERGERAWLTPHRPLTSAPGAGTEEYEQRKRGEVGGGWATASVPQLGSQRGSQAAPAPAGPANGDEGEESEEEEEDDDDEEVAAPSRPAGGLPTLADAAAAPAPAKVAAAPPAAASAPASYEPQLAGDGFLQAPAKACPSKQPLLGRWPAQCSGAAPGGRTHVGRRANDRARGRAEGILPALPLAQPDGRGRRPEEADDRRRLADAAGAPRRSSLRGLRAGYDRPMFAMHDPLLRAQRALVVAEALLTQSVPAASEALLSASSTLNALRSSPKPAIQSKAEKVRRPFSLALESRWLTAPPALHRGCRNGPAGPPAVGGGAGARICRRRRGRTRSACNRARH